jgi:Zn-dependent peptidase ImmA (M78 family)/transcriptional regulator with XRE-family HTH domain
VGDQQQIGARIRELREQLGIQAQDLATLVQLDPSAISNIEHGKRGVKSDELAAIAQALGVSPLAILDQTSLLARLPVSPRTSSGTLLKGDVLTRLTGLAELHEVLVECDIPTQALVESPGVETGNWLTEAKRLAEWVAPKLGALDTGQDRFSSLVRSIEENLGIDVMVEVRESPGVFGASITDAEFSLIFVNADQRATQALFTLAHELGHVLAKDGDSLIIVDDDLNPRSNNERFANAFAANLLLPEHKVRELIPSGSPNALTICRLLSDSGASFETLVYRLHNLRIVNASGRDQLKSLGLRGVIAQIDDPELIAQLLSQVAARPSRHPPSHLTRRAAACYRRGVIGARPLAGLIGVDAEEIPESMTSGPLATLGFDSQSQAAGGLSDVDLYAGSPV